MKKTIFASLRILVMIAAMLAVFASCGNTYSVEVEGGTGGGKYRKGETIEIKANEYSDKKFKEWQIDGEFFSKNNPLQYEVEGDVKIVAVFINVFSISVTGGQASNEKVNEGSQVTITAQVPVGKKFVNWTVNGEVLSDQNPYTFRPTSSMAITANFSDLQKVSVTVEGGMGFGEQTDDGKYWEDTYFVALANEVGKQFTGWKVNGTVVSTDSCYSFKVNGDVTLVATYDDTKTQFERPAPEIFSPEAPSGDGINIAMDRMFGVGGGNKGPSIFEEGTHFAGGTSIDFVLVYVYESKESEEPVAYFKYHMNTITSLDGTVEFTQPQQWSVPGNYYIFANEFSAFLIDIMGDDYNNEARYYFKNQLIAESGSDYANSEISEFSERCFTETIGDYYIITMENCRAPGGRYPDGQAHTVGIMEGESVTFTAYIPEGKEFVKWQIDDQDQEETGLTLTFTPTQACTVRAVLRDLPGGGDEGGEGGQE